MEFQSSLHIYILFKGGVGGEKSERMHYDLVAYKSTKLTGAFQGQSEDFLFYNTAEYYCNPMEEVYTARGYK